MGRPVNAFGIFAAERYPENKPVGLGDLGYLEGEALNFLAGRFYVKMLAFGLGDATESALTEVGAKVAGAIKPGSGLPALVTAFPKDGLVVRSEKYVKKNFMGYEFLRDGYVATYASGGREMEGFFIDGGSDRDAEAMLTKLLEALKSDGQTVGEDRRRRPRPEPLRTASLYRAGRAAFSAARCASRTGSSRRGRRSSGPSRPPSRPAARSGSEAGVSDETILQDGPGRRARLRGRHRPEAGPAGPHPVHPGRLPLLHRRPGVDLPDQVPLPPSGRRGHRPPADVRLSLSGRRSRLHERQSLRDGAAEIPGPAGRSRPRPGEGDRPVQGRRLSDPREPRGRQDRGLRPQGHRPVLRHPRQALPRLPLPRLHRRRARPGGRRRSPKRSATGAPAASTASSIASMSRSGSTWSSRRPSASPTA